MPNIYTMMDISRWALNTATRQLDTVSHNVANVNTDGYSRQKVVTATRNAEYTAEGWYGRGVQISNVIQYVDELLVGRISDKLSGQNYYDTRLSQLNQLEVLTNEAGDSSLGEQITAFFNAWQEVSNSPESTAVREVLSETSSNLINRLHTLMQDLNTIDNDIESYLTDATEEVNEICKRISVLNQEISQGEASGKPANDLRDERRNQINTLSELLNIQWFEESDGQVTVIAGEGKTIVQQGYPGPNDPDPLSYQSVSGYANNQLVWRNSESIILDTSEVTGGKIGAWLEVRDTDLPEMQDFFNTVANTLIYEVNKLHASGTGLDKLTDVTGTYQSSSTTAAFNDSSNTLAYKDEITSGSFDIWVYESGTRRSYTIDVSESDSLTTLMDKINLAMGDGGPPNLDASANPVASITSSNTLRINSSGGIEFAFANDTSNALAALGINTFFSGSTATSIELNDNITSDVRNIAAGRISSDGEHALGDNSNALDIADLKDADTMSSGSQTFNESVISWASNLGTEVSSANGNLEFTTASLDDLLDQRDSISGVNLDEEMVAMIRYQRSYQMAAKMISVADSLMATLMEI